MTYGIVVLFSMYLVTAILLIIAVLSAWTTYCVCGVSVTLMACCHCSSSCRDLYMCCRSAADVIIVPDQLRINMNFNTWIKHFYCVLLLTLCYQLCTTSSSCILTRVWRDTWNTRWWQFYFVNGLWRFPPSRNGNQKSITEIFTLHAQIHKVNKEKWGYFLTITIVYMERLLLNNNSTLMSNPLN